VVVVDRDLVVQLWNDSSTEMWGLRADEVLGARLLELDIGLPVGDLGEPLRQALAPGGDEHSFTLHAVNRRGQPFECTVRTLPLVTPEGDIYGAIVLMAEARRR
jgi:two-component system, chemotaxis family, CheB/CheR fusion protein